jgi:hypothetical protein
MLKFCLLTSVTTLLSVSITSLALASQVAPPEFRPGTAAVCGLYNLSGYLALDSQGQVVPLHSYCQQQRNWVWYENTQFWKTFRKIAAPDTLTYTQSLNRERVEAYAQSICPFLKQGGSLQELNQIQDQQLPAAFDQTVTNAAIRTYCPQHRVTQNQIRLTVGSETGRSD